MPNKWVNVHSGDDEFKFFVTLARTPDMEWLTVRNIANMSGLSKERVEEIIVKYYKKGMVFQNPKNDDMWGYWERVPHMLPKPIKPIYKKDQDIRINRNIDREC